MKLLVTGGAGFIGSNFVRHILNKYPNYKVVNLDKLTYAGNLENLKDIEGNPNYTFVKGDICDKQIVEKVMKECDAVVNFAAETHVDRSIRKAYSFVKTDVVGTMVLLEAVKKFGIKKFLHISTDEVYGSIDKGAFHEDDKLEPSSPYSASKASADMLILSYKLTYGLPVIITRSSNNYGPYQYPEKFIPLFITNLIEGKKIPLYGDGKNVRDWIYVEDNCKGVDLVLHKGEIGEIYNIGANIEKTNIEVVKIILENLEKTEEEIQYVKDRPGHDRRYSLSTEKIKELGWEPMIDFNTGIKKTIEWFKANESWWKKLKDGSYYEYYKKQYEE